MSMDTKSGDKENEDNLEEKLDSRKEVIDGEMDTNSANEENEDNQKKSLEEGDTTKCIDK